jgi:hypothetical protein
MNNNTTCYKKQLEAAEKYLNSKKNLKYSSIYKGMFLIIIIFIFFLTFILLKVPLPK